MAEDGESALRLPLVGLLVVIAAGGAIDLAFDRPASWRSAHVLYELFLIAAALATAAWLWLRWRRAEQRTVELRRAVGERQAERDAWRASAEQALEGLAQAIDRQLGVWELTPAERDVVVRLLKGKSHKEIASASGRSERTVRQHAAAAYRKAGLGGGPSWRPTFCETCRWVMGCRKLALGFRLATRWTGVRVAEGAGLENRYTLTGIVGSNPTLSVPIVFPRNRLDDLTTEVPERGFGCASFFGESEDRPPHGAPVVVVSSAFWKSALGGRTDVIGTRLRLGALTTTIIGVTPDGFVGIPAGRFPAEVFLPISTVWATYGEGTDGLVVSIPDQYSSYVGNLGGVEMLVRRKPGVSETSASADLTIALRRSYEAQRSADPSSPSLNAARPQAAAGPLRIDRCVLGRRAPCYTYGPEASIAAWVGALSIIVLLVAAANVANLMLARVASRRREMEATRGIPSSPMRVGEVLQRVILIALGYRWVQADAEFRGATR